MSKNNEALLEAYNLGYRISKNGIELKTPFNILKQKQINSSGYPVFAIRLYDKVFHIAWHRLQAYQKYGEELFKEGVLVRHKNNVKADCSWKNILIGTAKDNTEDNPREDVLKYALNATDKWRKYNATEVKEFYNKCKSYKLTKEKFHISSSGTLHFILNKARYS